MKNYGISTVSELIEDRLVFRNLAPIDPRLPSLDSLRLASGLPLGPIPRKQDPQYAQVIVGLLKHARQLDVREGAIQRLLYLGDTRLSDGTAFINLCQAGGWPGLAFIGAENSKPANIEVVPAAEGCSLYLSNRWSALAEFDRYCLKQGLVIDEATAVVIDLDKTAIGARGRNAAVIDEARVQAVAQTVSGLLGDSIDQETFQTIYNRLNQPEFHPFTADNQDYLAYICLILGYGLIDLEGLISAVQAGQLTSFEQFIAQVNEQEERLPTGLRTVHHRIYTNVQNGDPTPFKTFRYNEYLTTIGRMGCLEDDAPVEKLLKEEIVITAEVRALALSWKARGALLFGLSDKPDEASLPSPEQAAQGYKPIHRKPTHIVGDEK
jgi:hypothetical protein